MGNRKRQPCGHWTWYIEASAAIDPQPFAFHEQQAPSDFPEYRVEVDLTVGIQHDGSVSISGTPRGDIRGSGRALVTIDLTLEEAERLRDHLVWALADLPGTNPPP